MNLIEETRAKYQATLDYYKTSQYGNAVDEIWADNMSTVHTIMRDSPTAEKALDAVDRTYLYSINFPQDNSAGTGDWKIEGDTPQIREYAVDWLLDNQRRMGLNLFDLPPQVQESPLIHARNQVTRNGRIVSGNFLRTLSCFKQIEKHFPLPAKPRVLELGAGCGHQARTFTLFHPDCRYLIADLPETLCFSYMFLRLSFPHKSCLFVTNEKELDQIDRHDFVFLPALLAPRLAGREFDLFINTASMGEMRNDVIEFWMDLIQNKAKIHFLFTLNRYLNTIYPDQYAFRLKENHCSVLYDANWEMLNWELSPSYTRCPYMDTLHARYVEIVARREPQQDKESRAKKLLDEVLAEDWLRVANMHNGGIMTARDNVMVHDMTMCGPLFKLWESIRLHPTKKAVETMIQLLERLICHPHEGKVFEELFYYRDLLGTF